MVSWGFAFRKGFVIFLWSLVWVIIGTVITLVIAGGALFAYLADPTGSAAGAIGLVILGFIVGALFSSIGIYAAILKITLESTMGQAPQQTPPRAPS